MQDIIQISKINDFLFCPYSLYAHAVYDSFLQNVYHDIPQKTGKIAHENIDKNIYSDKKRYLQGMSVYSEKFCLVGKIDVFDQEERTLIERKYRIHKVYDGHIYQLWSQMFALEEMGYEVEKLLIHSLSDNKRYKIDLPDNENKKKYKDLLQEMRGFVVGVDVVDVNIKKCEKCIYRELCGECLC